LYILVCTEEEHFSIHEDMTICARLADTREGQLCQVAQLFHHSVQIFYYFPDFGEYYFYLVHCFPPDTRVKIDLTLLNPSDNHLPSALIPVPTLFVIMGILWVVVLCIWLFVSLPQLQNMTIIHYVMLTYPVLKVVYAAFSVQYFYGYQITGELTLTSWVLYRLFSIVVMIDFHFILLVLSKAWSLSGSLDKSDCHVIFSLLVGLCCSMMFKLLYEEGSDVTYLLASLAYIGLRVMILACIFININHTIGRLESEMLNYNVEPEQMASRQAIVKLHKVFILLKFSLMLWVILNVVEFFCNILFFGGTDQNWVDMMNTEYIDFLLGICIGILLLPNISLQPLFDPNRNENGEQELTTFRRSTARPATENSGPNPNADPNHTHAQSTHSDNDNDNDSVGEDDSNNGIIIMNGRIPVHTESRSEHHEGADAIEIVGDGDDDEVELVDRRKRRIRV